jgi:DNA-binding IclR family transcriptional regulator
VPGLRKSPAVRSVARTIDILNALAEGPLSAGEAAFRIDLPKTTAYRLLVTLEQGGFVIRSNSGSDFQLGPRLLQLAMRTAPVVDLRDSALPVMRQLRTIFGETVNLNIRVGRERLCVASVDGIHEIRSVGVVGQSSPLHSGAAARAILAFLPDEQIQAYLTDGPLTALAIHTITDPAQLWETVRKARRLGYVVSAGERTEGAMSIGAPVWNAEAEVAGSINITGPTSRMSTYDLDALAAAVVDAGRAVSSTLGYVPRTGG